MQITDILYHIEDFLWSICCLIMPYERQCVVFHRQPYNLHETIVHCYDRFNRQVEERCFIHHDVFDSVISTLYDLKYLVAYDSTDYIPDLYGGMLIPLDVFFRRYGRIDETFAADPVHVMDFPVSEVELSRLSESEASEDVISEEEEDDLVLLSHILRIECPSFSDSDDSDYIPTLE